MEGLKNSVESGCEIIKPESLKLESLRFPSGLLL